ncbi:hypothetical protein [Planococcus donghaensis]|uniref:Uncharacterized protein n=1 Tax=Planococcus donghaensis TaxID=414778 RepID=A0A1C7EE19_9BACL|nr:hypothetical protein [Planococcus donghaensis]ANU22008.1 hypothetical protein BCM40_01045 [Planococcus donghaensis]
MKAVGFDQKIQLAHLDTTANLLRHYTDKKDMYTQLDAELLGSIKGAKSRKNAITMLMKTWSLVEPSIQDIREKLVAEYPYLNAIEKKFVHYCLVCIAYPYFREQMIYVGKNLKMADEVYSRTTLSQMKNLYGDRRRVEVATSAVFSSIKEWDILNRIQSGVYEKKQLKLILENSLLSSLLLEVLMAHHETNTISLEVINTSAIFFPFNYHVRIGDLDRERFTIITTIRDTIIEKNPTVPCSFE